MSEQWVPHQRETWPWRIGRLTREVEFREWINKSEFAEPRYRTWLAPVGTLVKIVMVSRLGDVGITDDLTADRGYLARVQFDALEPAEAIS